MPNWKNIKKLRDHLASMKITRYRRFDMSDYIQVTGSATDAETLSVKRLRANGPECGSVACLAGETVIALAPEKLRIPVMYNSYLNCSFIADNASKILGLSMSEENHMFSGEWTRTPLGSVTRKQAVKYLDKAIAAKNVMVVLS